MGHTLVCDTGPGDYDAQATPAPPLTLVGRFGDDAPARGPVA